MSRAMQLAMSEKEARSFCAKENVGVSVVEPLPGGGVRLVCNSATGAEILRQKAKAKIMSVEGPRQKHRPDSPLW